MDVNRYLEHCSEQQNHQVQINDCSSQNGSMKTDNAVLEERVETLRETMRQLKSQLDEEKARWKMEMEEMNLLLASMEREGSDIEARSIGMKMNYDDPLSRYHTDKRFSMRRHLAANSYRKRLSEVEKLCQEELAKVQETATHLEPLKQMSSEWSKNHTITIDTIKPPPTVVETDLLGGKGDDIPVKQIDGSLVVDEDVSSEIEGKICFQINRLPSDLATIRYAAKFE